MRLETIERILSEVMVKLEDIFGENMLFGFVCGGFSNGYADKNHDVDIFVCLRSEPTKEVGDEYLQWYFDLHKRYGLKADYDYLGEIVIYEKLAETLAILKDLKLTLQIESVQTKKAIIWADMITSKTASETGSDLGLLYRLKRKYKKYPKQWKREVLALITEEEREKWITKNHLLIMEHFMIYPKHDGKKLEKYYS